MSNIRSISTNIRSSIEYCRALTRQKDYENYLASLFLKNQNAMKFQWVLRAINAETSQVRDIITNDATGKMRLLWWKEAISQTFNLNPPKNPVLESLSHVLPLLPNVSKMWFTKLVTARHDDLSIRQYQTFDYLERYIEDTQSSLLYLTLESNNRILSRELDHAASHCGKAIGLVQVLKSLEFNARKDWIYIPAELFMKHSLSSGDFLRFHRKQDLYCDKEKFETAFNNIVYDVASRANYHLQKVTNNNENMRVLRLFSHTTKTFLNILEKNNFDLQRTKTVLGRRQWRLPLEFYFI